MFTSLKTGATPVRGYLYTELCTPTMQEMRKNRENSCPRRGPAKEGPPRHRHDCLDAIFM